MSQGPEAGLVFLSFDGDTAVAARQLALALRRAGLDVWCSAIPGQIPPGADFWDEIAGAMRRARVMLLLRCDSTLSEGVKKELNYLGQLRREKGVDGAPALVPVLVPPMKQADLGDLHLRIGSIQLTTLPRPVELLTSTDVEDLVRRLVARGAVRAGAVASTPEIRLEKPQISAPGSLARDRRGSVVMLALVIVAAVGGLGWQRGWIGGAPSGASSDGAQKDTAVTGKESPPADSVTRPVSPRRSPLSMMDIHGGTFLMGAPVDEADSSDSERPLRSVIVRPFLLAETETTRGQWKEAGLPSPIDWGREDAFDPSLPANFVSWHDAANFCNVISAREGLPMRYREVNPGEFAADPSAASGGYRLPSEAEWEWACRSQQLDGSRSPYSVEVELLPQHGWYFMNSGAKELPAGTLWDLARFDQWQLRPRPVKGKSPNRFGLFDMHGNVAEWCEDEWYSDYVGAPTDGSTRATAAWGDKVLRGGAYCDPPRSLRSAARDLKSASGKNDAVGFRVARSLH